MLWIWALVLSTSLLALVGFARAGSTVFWKETVSADFRPLCAPGAPLPLVAIGVLLASLVLLTVFAGPITLWLDEAAAQLYQPSHYIDAVLGAAGGNE